MRECATKKSCETESLICGASHQKTPSVRSTWSEANFVNGIHYSVSHNALHTALMTQTTALPTAHGLHTSTSLTWFQLLKKPGDNPSQKLCRFKPRRRQSKLDYTSFFLFKGFALGFISCPR